MFKKLENQKNKMADWLLSKAQGPAAKAWLAFISFSESVILPIPTAAFLVPILMAGTKRWVYLVSLTTIFSILGGVTGYFIFAFFFDVVGIKIVEFYNLGKQLEEVKILYDGNAFIVNFIGAFTPIPYKLFVFASGFLKSSFLAFILASVLGRGMQFFLIGYIMHLIGENITKIFLRYFNYVILFLIAIVILSFLI